MAVEGQALQAGPEPDHAVSCVGWSYGYQSGIWIYYGSYTSCSSAADYLYAQSSLQHEVSPGNWQTLPGGQASDACLNCSFLTISGIYPAQGEVHLRALTFRYLQEDGQYDWDWSSYEFWEY